jgi:ClpP class serine protease
MAHAPHEIAIRRGNSPLAFRKHAHMPAKARTARRRGKRTVRIEEHLRKTFVDSIAQGRVWSGTDALEIGLVDELGGIDKAIAYAADKAGLTSYSIKEFPKQEDPLENLFKTETQEYYTKAVMKNNLGASYKYLEAIENISRIEGIQALMPMVVVE